ncbi:MAG: hypothetical protein MJ165_00680 [Alphaproteobacteria bacterium]|nr:hypothetical protein [Alphaproteobacteria bacterium]
MKKFLLFLSFCIFPGLASAGYYYTSDNAFDSHKSVWGNPTMSDTVVEHSANVGKFEIKKKTLSKYHSSHENTKKYETFVALVAHEIATHGAKFCLTQIGSWIDSDQWIFYQVPYVPGSFQCAWFCEPGYDGHGCHDETSAASACDTTNYKQTYEYWTGDGDLKPLDIWSRSGAAQQVKFFTSGFPVDRWGQAVILGATDFLDHGLVVKPILLSRHGTSTSLGLASIPANGVTKTLCAQGFTKNDKCEMSSGTCGNIDWCRYWNENEEWGQFVKNGYNSTTHYKEPDEEWVDTSDHSKGKRACYNPKCKNGMDFGTDLKCSSCADSVVEGFCDVEGNANKGKCMKCNVGQYFSKTDCECKQVSTIIDKKYLESGPYADKQCWSIADLTEYRTCVLGETASDSGDSN